VLAGPGERVCLDARRHGIVLARPLSRALLLAAVGAFLFTLPWPSAVAGALLVAVGAVLALRAVWRWERTRLVITTEKLFVVEGTLRRRAKAVRFRSLETVELEESLPGRLLGYGTLVAGALEIEHVPHPKRVYQLVERLCA
jgi:uncharacterized membrane protein YdbT with pleckstrin-like domain